MARVPIKSSMCSPVNGSGLVGIECTITKHVPGGPLGSGEAAKIYLSETEGSQVAGNTVVTDQRGELTQGESTSWAEYWLVPGSYDYYWHGTGTKPFYVVKEMISAGPEGIGTEQIAGESVTEGKLANGAVSEGKLGEEAVGNSKLKALAVTAAKIASGAITAAKLGAEAVETSAIKALAVTTAKIAEEAITGPKLGAETLKALKGSAYGAITERSSGTEYEASATRPVWVTVVGNTSAGYNGVGSFWVLPGVKWKAVGSGETLTPTVGGTALPTIKLPGTFSQLYSQYLVF